MNLFISYARVDKAACVEVAEILDIFDVWYDQRLYAGQGWWQEILNRLDECDGFIYLISPHSVNSKYCRKEFEIATRLHKLIFPVVIEETELPEELQDIHYMDMTRGPHSSKAVQALMKSVIVASRTLATGGIPVPALPVDSIPPEETELEVDDEFKPVRMIGQAADAMETGDFDDAVRLLKQAKEHGYFSRYIDVDALLQEAESSLKLQTDGRTLHIEYRKIHELVKRSATRAEGCQAFRRFHHEHPSYDPENVLGMCTRKRTAQPTPPGAPAPARRVRRPTEQTQSRRRLQLLEWCFIPDGLVINDNESARVPDFSISKYPITNAQYMLFLKTKNGYRNPEWWRFSEYAYNWFRRNPVPHRQRYAGDERPRESVTWFEAMAFCRWLSYCLNIHITLPTRNQWRRAAQGEDSRLYPWGDEFDKSLCNTRESRIRMTTVVMRYDGGVSPFGVMDMAGNVWEWCLDPINGTPEEIATNEPRALQGGSFITSYHRAQSTFSFYLAQEYYYGTIGFRVVRLD